jgi:predicted RNase H-like nuclease (RuvC/YqgF family)
VSDSVEPHAAELNTLTQGELKSMEVAFNAMWESARRAAEAITRMREEKHSLTATVERLEKELEHLRRETAQLKRQVAEQEHGHSVGLAGDDRDALALRIKELIARLDAYL